MGRRANVVPDTAQSEYYLRSVDQEALVALGADGPGAGQAMKRIRLAR
jgi:metal-dependent amidase/aminoacylase/carboxypeptidase family protein